MDPTQFKPKIPLQRKNSGKTNLPKSLSKLRLLSKGNKPLSMLVLGDPQVGKSSVLSKYKKNDFVNLYEATLSHEAILSQPSSKETRAALPTQQNTSKNKKIKYIAYNLN